MTCNRAPFIILLLLPLLALRFLLPVGYMPSFAEKGSLQLTICSEDGFQQIAVDPITMQPVEKGHALQKNHCVFALSAFFAPLFFAPAFIEKILAPENLFSFFAQEFLSSFSFLSSAPRGPPSFV